MSSMTKIRITRTEHHFAAAHYLIEMGKCERLHGHTYGVTVELAGRTGANNTIIDFNTINPIIAGLCENLDHRTLIAEKEKRQEILATDTEVVVRYRDKRLVFPRKDVALLPIPATTVEFLARYLSKKLMAKLEDWLENIRWVEVGVKEGDGQMALYRRAVERKEGEAVMEESHLKAPPLEPEEEAE